MPVLRAFVTTCFTTAAMTLLIACSGGGGTSAGSGGGGGIPPTQPTATPVPTAPPSSAPGTLSVSTSSPASTVLGSTTDGYTGTISVPAGSNATMMTVGLTSTLPAGTPVVQTIRRMTKDLAPGQNLTVRTYITMTATTSVSFPATPAFTLTLPALPTRQEFDYIAAYDPTHASLGWQILNDVAASESGALMSFPAATANMSFVSGITYDFAVVAVNAPLS